MNDRQQLEILSEEIDVLKDAVAIVGRNIGPLYEKLTKLYVKIILDEKLLAQTWKITSTKHILDLEAVEDWQSFPKLRKLLKPDYHERYSFFEGFATYLSFDDGTVSLQLEHAVALQFIRDHGIIVDLSNLTAERDVLITKLATANALLDDVGELEELGETPC